MAVPASVIPAGNSYSVHVAGPDSVARNFSAPNFAPQNESRLESNVLLVTAAVTSALLKPHSVDVRQYLAGDDPVTQKYRDFLARSGAKTSAFSPAPIPGLPGEGFWKTTLAVVQASGDNDFWWPPRADKKVEWDCLLVALYDGSHPVANLPAAKVRSVDLWIVSTPSRDAAADVEKWVTHGAGAVAVIGPAGIAWASHSVTFGNAQGAETFDESRNILPGEVPEGALPAFPDSFHFGCFAGGVVAGLIEELLGENLFDKSIVRVERNELEARPLHVARATLFGGAAARASCEEAPERLLHKEGDLTGRVRALIRAEHPEGKPWGSKGR